MADEEKIVTEEVTAENYKTIVDDVRNNYEKQLADERAARLADAKNYATAVLNGQTAPAEEKGPNLKSSAEYKADYNSFDELRTKDIDRWVTMLNWRDAALAEGKGDIFCLTKPGSQPTEEAKLSAERTADVIKQCIEDSNYDDQLFKALLDKRLSDPAILRRK